MAERQRQILVAGVGNTWLSDDGFGSAVVKRLGELELPDGVTVLDFGTGGLDLAYEVMRGYDALLLVDVSQQGGEPGTLYVIDPNDEEIKPIDDGEVINPHAMDPQTVLRFIKTVGGSPGKVTVVACEPSSVEEMGLGLTPAVEAAVGRAVDLVIDTIAGLQTDAAYEDAEAGGLMHELSVAQAIVDTATRHADGRGVKLVTLRLGTLRQVVPDSLTFYFEIVARDTLCEGATLEHELVAARLRCPDCGFEWDPAPPPLATHGPVEGVPTLPTFRCPDCETPGEVEAGGELEVESIEVEDAAGAGVP